MNYLFYSGDLLYFILFIFFPLRFTGLFDWFIGFMLKFCRIGCSIAHCIVCLRWFRFSGHKLEGSGESGIGGGKGRGKRWSELWRVGTADNELYWRGVKSAEWKESLTHPTAPPVHASSKGKNAP